MGSIAKAVAAFFTSLGTWGATSLADGHLAGVEWFGLCGVVVATAAVWQVTNTAPEVMPAAVLAGAVAKAAKKKARSSKGQVDVVTILVIVLIVVLIVWLLGGVPNR